jgi:hypothetical protein
VANLVHAAQQEASLADIRGVATGVLPPLQMSSGVRYNVSDPQGGSSSQTADAEGMLRGIAAPFVGPYVIRQGSQQIRRVGASLSNAQETSLKSATELDFREQKVAAATTRLKTDRPLWTWLAWIGLGIMLVEWWYFHRG